MVLMPVWLHSKRAGFVAERQPVVKSVSVFRSHRKRNFAILGLLLFAYFVRKAGVWEISGGIRRLGFAFLLIFILGGVRQAAHSVAWINCFEPPYRLRFIDAFKARLMGEALGNMLPLGGIVVAEPSKAVFARDRVPLMAGASALAIENIFYALSVALFISRSTTWAM